MKFCIFSIKSYAMILYIWLERHDMYVMVVQFSKSPEGHACYIWKNYVLLSAARKVVVVAHSYGGQVTSVLVLHALCLFV